MWAVDVERFGLCCMMCQYAVLLKDTIIIRNVFGTYKHFVEILQHLNNAIH